MSNTAKYAEVCLDYAAHTPVDPEVLRVMLPYFGEIYRNPSSMHEGGRRAKAAIEKARETTARAINAKPEEVIFTGSGTESDNLAILGAARAYRSEGDHVIVSATEHKAALESARMLERDGFRVTVLPVNHYGIVDTSSLLEAITDRTVLVSLIYANNELGSVNPITKVSQAIANVRGARRMPLFHTDACQAMSYLPVDVEELGVDLMTFNGAKVYGPSGVAALYIRTGVRIEPLLRGGEQEHLLRPGTQSVPLIAGFTAAIELARSQRMSESERLLELRKYFIARLCQEVPGLIVNGHPKAVLPTIVHVTIPGVEGEAMLLMLDARGIRVSTGSACSAFDLRPSHVLSAIGQESDIIHGSIRFSFGRDTTKEKLDYVLTVFPEIVSHLRKISAVTTSAYAMQHR